MTPPVFKRPLLCLALAGFTAQAMVAPAEKDSADHWSFKPVIHNLDDGSIDGFVGARLHAAGLAFSPPASPAVWLRRVTLDLTGLPPEPDEVEAFVENPDYFAATDALLASPHYGERWAQHWLDVIRWAETVGFETNIERENAWQYRDWVITSLNADKPYDRFVFEQIAGDTVGEDAALGFLVAGPANLPGQVGRDEAAMREARQDELDEVIRTVSQGFFGLTIGCARCHDHKFDPILQKDYYSMQAVFSGLGYGTRRLRGAENDEWTRMAPIALEEMRRLKADLESFRLKHKLKPALEDIHTEEFRPVEAAAIRMRIQATANHAPASLYEFEAGSAVEGEDGSTINVALAANGATPSASSFALANQSRHFDNLIDGSTDPRQAYPWESGSAGPAWFRIDFDRPYHIDQFTLHRGSSMPVEWVVEVLPANSTEWTEVAHARDRMLRLDDIRSASAVQVASLEPEALKVLCKLLASVREAEARYNRLSAGPQVYAASFNPSPSPTYFLYRGDPMQRREEVPPAIPAFLGRMDLPPETSESERRVALAQHLMRSDHPLASRVMVNRIWHHHFGTGIVRTPSDFGKRGALPSHPELLDWLAKKFIEEGWSLKRLHRLIVTSRTYRQSSFPRSEAIDLDAESRLLWRFPPRRLEAEAIRDSILSVSGKLNRKMGGRGFDFFSQRGGLSDYHPKETFDQEGWRRMIYAHKIRMIPTDIFGAFDCPDAGQMKPARTRSINPIQALGLFNSPFVNRQAAFFADRLRFEAGADPEAQVDRAFALAFARPPTPDERTRLVELAVNHGLEQVCRALFNTSEFSTIQ